MIVYDFATKTDFKSVIALGRFDGLHLGHQKLIDKVISLAKELNAKPMLFFIEDDNRKTILNKQDFLLKCEEFNICDIICGKASREFYSIDCLTFLSTLKNNFNPIAFVCGIDYTFGKDKQGNSDILIDYADKNDIKHCVLDLLKEDNEKISSSKIRELLQNGDINSANRLLGKNYQITSKVIKGFGVGKSLGFPTANIKVDNTIELKQGVYKTRTIIDSVVYKSITNYGTQPTFMRDNFAIETYILNDNIGDIYDKQITIVFDGYIREIKKFDSVKELKEQIQKDGNL